MINKVNKLMISKIIFTIVVLLCFIGCKDETPSVTKKQQGRIDYTDQFNRISIQGHDYLKWRGHSQAFIHEPECKKCADKLKPQNEPNE